MTKEQIKDYSLKVSQSNKSQLVAVTYEIMLAYLKEAVGYARKEDREKFIFSCKKAKQFLNYLDVSLNMEYDISENLSKIYQFCNLELTKDIAVGRCEHIEPVIGMLEKLYHSFEEVAKQDESAQLMGNDSQVYAGLTYGKGTLNETVVKGTLFQG